MNPATAYIALGSNLGDRRSNIEAALRWLNDTPGVRVIKVSSLLENPAVGGPTDSPAFLNAVAEVHTSLQPRELLDVLLDAEVHLGRVRGEKWSPRTIDLDILLYDDRIIAKPGLQIPHPLMHERRFVLEPLAEIAAGALHPVLQLTARDLLQRL
jgi:2-amino-4-hydroxy-6-hydroxymethyldihydropteridine diphosphokinase